MPVSAAFSMVAETAAQWRRRLRDGRSHWHAVEDEGIKLIITSY